MSKCPSCNNKIKYLDEVSLQEVHCFFRANKEREVDESHSTHDILYGWPVQCIKFTCPICKIILFTDEDEANNFLLDEYLCK